MSNPNNTGANIIRELMQRWDEYRAKWIDAHGTEEGFSDWFTAQVQGPVK